MSERAVESLGGYDVLAEIFAGGMGEVYIARKRAVGGFERLVALKTVRSELAALGSAREMFLDEGRLLARLHHRGIAQVYDFGEDGDRLYLAMEYVAGVDFDDVAARTPPPRIACLAMAEVCRALHAAHELTDNDGQLLGVVHRDVSPGNLMLTYDGQVKVLDFGIALMRNRRAPVTEFGMLKGKPPYMAPEQVRSESIDARTDVFSASAVLWELLTGERLFTGDSIYAIGRAIETGAVRVPSTIREGLPSELDALVLQGLAVKPADRFQSAGSLANGLEGVARRLGAETLADYARQELADDRVAHEAYITELVKKARPTRSRVGRGTAVNTIPAIDELGLAETASGGSEPAALDETGGRRPWALWLVVLGLVAIVPIVVWQIVGGRAGDDLDAGVLDGHAADARGLALDSASGPARLDAAAVPRALDASPTRIDAGRVRRRDAGRDDPRVRSDARPITAPKSPDAGSIVAAGTATLTLLRKDGWANVFLDGDSLGPTPIYGRKVPAGPHTIVFRDGTNNVLRTVSISLKPGQSKVVNAD